MVFLVSFVLGSEDRHIPTFLLLLHGLGTLRFSVASPLPIEPNRAINNAPRIRPKKALDDVQLSCCWFLFGGSGFLAGGNIGLYELLGVQEQLKQSGPCHHVGFSFPWRGVLLEVGLIYIYIYRADEIQETRLRHSGWMHGARCPFTSRAPKDHISLGPQKPIRDPNMVYNMDILV